MSTNHETRAIVTLSYLKKETELFCITVEGFRSAITKRRDELMKLSYELDELKMQHDYVYFRPVSKYHNGQVVINRLYGQSNGLDTYNEIQKLIEFATVAEHNRIEIGVNGLDYIKRASVDPHDQIKGWLSASEKYLANLKSQIEQQKKLLKEREDLLSGTIDPTRNVSFVPPPPKSPVTILVIVITLAVITAIFAKLFGA